MEGQLSIFEVDPGAVSITPDAQPEPEQEEPVYTGPEWSGIELGEHPEQQPIILASTVRQEPRFDLAPFSRRLMTWVVDGALILAAFFLVAMYAVSHMAQVPAPKAAEIFGAAGVALFAILYQALFFSFGLSTPGMRYAGVALSTFDDELATAAQTRRRFGATLLSMVPFGLGLVWAVFDEDHLSWHDRFSGTYLRKRI